jgi:hypothetical protein
VDRRKAVAEDLRALADDLKSLLESVTTDPKERRRKELQFTALQGALGVATTLVARRLVVKIWGILTGEEAPKRPPTEAVRRVEQRAPAVSAPEAETMSQPQVAGTSQPESETISSSSSSVK